MAKTYWQNVYEYKTSKQRMHGVRWPRVSGADMEVRAFDKIGCRPLYRIKVTMKEPA